MAGMLVVQEVFFTEEREPAKVIDAIAAIIDRKTGIAEAIKIIEELERSCNMFPGATYHKRAQEFLARLIGE